MARTGQATRRRARRRGQLDCTGMPNSFHLLRARVADELGNQTEWTWRLLIQGDGASRVPAPSQMTEARFSRQPRVPRRFTQPVSTSDCVPVGPAAGEEMDGRGLANKKGPHSQAQMRDPESRTHISKVMVSRGTVAALGRQPADYRYVRPPPWLVQQVCTESPPFLHEFAASTALAENAVTSRTGNPSHRVSATFIDIVNGWRPFGKREFCQI